MKKGLFRLNLQGRGECARTHFLSGDAAPFLERAAYEALNFDPPFESLPTKEEYWSRPPDRRVSAKRCDSIDWSMP